jgi:PleD family two-component response regulator
MVAYHDAVPMKKSILVADHSDARLSALLSGHELAFVNTPDEAKRTLAGRNFDLIVIGVHFDESRMFDLLRHVRGQERHRATPVVCVLSAEFARHAVTAEGLEIAVKAMGGTAYVDLQTSGDSEARRVVDELLGD